MAWMMDTYAMTVGHAAHGVVTGKPTSIGGSNGREEAMARGLVAVVEEACKLKKIPLRAELLSPFRDLVTAARPSRAFSRRRKQKSSPSATLAAASPILAASIR